MTTHSTDKVTELIDVLDGLVPLLKELKYPQWADHMESARTWIANSDFYGVEYLLRAYGGMGSLNDLIGDRRFDLLRHRAYELADSIRREQNG